MITKAVHIYLRTEDEAADRKAIAELYAAEPGSKIVIFVGDRWMTPGWATAQIAQFITTMHVEFQGSVTAIDNWTKHVLGDDGLGVSA